MSRSNVGVMVVFTTFPSSQKKQNISKPLVISEPPGGTVLFLSLSINFLAFGGKTCFLFPKKLILLSSCTMISIFLVYQ